MSYSNTNNNYPSWSEVSRTLEPSYQQELLAPVVDPAVTPITPTNRTFRGKPVKPKDAQLPDDILAYKARRKAGTVASAWVGGVVGLITLGPLGAAGGAGLGYGLSKSIGKARERKLIKNHHESGTLVPPVRKKKRLLRLPIRRGQLV